MASKCRQLFSSYRVRTLCGTTLDGSQAHVDPERGEIWGDASNLIAGIKLLPGVDPKKDKVAR
jgi:hypothetical protein